MAEIKIFDAKGAASGTADVPEKLSSANSPVTLVHQVAIAELAGRRQGTAKTKRRDEVQGSNVKIRRQKGTGRSRQGDKRTPHMRGGGVVHGPRPRDYSENTPRKMKQAAFRTVLNSRLQNDRIFVMDGDIASGKTKDFVALLATMGLSNYKLLLIANVSETNLQFGARNLPKVTVQGVHQTNVTDVLRADAILCTKAAWQEMSERVESKVKGKSDSSGDKEAA